MRTREQSINNFCSVLDNLINSRYLFAGSKIFDLLKTINSSKLLSDMFNYFTDGFDFEKVLSDSIVDDAEEKAFYLPEKSSDAITLVYLLLREINNKNAQLTDLLDYFDAGKNYELAFKNFSTKVLLPFKKYVYEIAMQLIQNTRDENEFSSKELSLDKNLNIGNENISENVDSSFIKNDKIQLNTKAQKESNTSLLRLLDLDRLAITQSRISLDDRNELLFVLDIFVKEIKGGDVEKIKLAYFAYYYALRPYRKIKNNLKEITESLMNSEII